MKGLKDPGFASRCLGVFIMMLRERYTDTEIKWIFKRANVESALKILDQEGEQS